MTIQNEAREGTNYVKGVVASHPLSVRGSHWQLRDVLCCTNPSEDSNDNVLYYVYKNSVSSYDTQTKVITNVFPPELKYAPSSLTIGCGYLAVGGQKSELTVQALKENRASQIEVGGSINNSLNISNHCGEDRLLVSNNDERIKVYSLPSLTHVTNIRVPVAVNYASVSPDGKKLVAVGDSNEVFLFDVTNGYERISVLRTGSDSGFSCSWRTNSEQFAVASQDGQVAIWDIRFIPNSDSRSPSPSTSFHSSSSTNNYSLATLYSKQIYSNVQVTGACRNVKFSPNSSFDLLAFSEHTSYVHLVDTRTFIDQQILKVSTLTQDIDPKPEISGICFSPDAKTFFVGTSTMVNEYDIDTVARRTFPFGSIN